MELSKYAKGTIAFFIVLIAAHYWTMLSSVFNKPWHPWPPIVPLMKDWVVPFMHHIYRPLLLGVSGLVVYWLWQGERRSAGYAMAFIFAAISFVFGFSIVIFNTITGFWSAVFTMIVGVTFPAAMATWYSAQGYLKDRS